MTNGLLTICESIFTLGNENPGCYFISHKVSLKLHQISGCLRLQASNLLLGGFLLVVLCENKAKGRAEEERRMASCFTGRLVILFPFTGYCLRRRTQEVLLALISCIVLLMC